MPLLGQSRTLPRLYFDLGAAQRLACGHMRQPKKNLLKAINDNPNKLVELAAGTATGIGVSLIKALEQGSIASMPMEMVGSMVTSAIRGDILRTAIQHAQELYMLGSGRASEEAARELFSVFIDTLQHIPPHERDALNTAKKLFLAGLQEGDDSERHLLQTFLHITSKLTSNDILVLRGCEQLRRITGANDGTVGSLHAWADGVAKESLHGIRELVLSREANLMDQQLIGERHPEDRYRVMLASAGRLTGLGKAYCKFLTEVEP